MAELETFLDVGQVAEMLGLSTATIRKWVLIRYIPYQKLGRAGRFFSTGNPEMGENPYRETGGRTKNA
jgi:hypothetical protein